MVYKAWCDLALTVSPTFSHGPLPLLDPPALLACVLLKDLKICFIFVLDSFNKLFLLCRTFLV